MTQHQTVRVVASLSAALVAGCGSSTARTKPPAASAAVGSARPASVSAGQGGVDAPGTGERLFANVGSDGTGGTARSVTRVAVFARDGRNRSVRLVPGAWSLPAAIPGQSEGISWDGSRVVLVAKGNAGRFLALATRSPHAAPRVVAPRGRFVYDGLSADGTQLFLTERGTAGGAPRYRIRRYDLTTGRLDPKPIVDKQEPGEAMVGDPVARASAADFLYTVYERRTRPFVHALESRGDYSLCIDLPREEDRAAPGAWSARRIGPGVVAIRNGALRTAYRLEHGRMTTIAYGDIVE